MAASISVAFAFTLAACSGSSTVATNPSGTGALGPDILQNGSPPPRWVVFQDNHLALASDDQLVVDRLGKVWYTEAAVQRVAFSTMDHRQGAVCTGTCGGIETSEPRGIAVGPDKKIWYADYFSVVGTLTNLLQTATVVKYATPGFHPFRIVAGPDGNLWVTLPATDNIHDAIGKMSTSGVLTTYPVPTTSSGVWGIAVGPDGKIWFSEIRAHKVGKLDPNTGAIVEYPVGDFFPANIAWAKGLLYMTGSATKTIGVMNTAGQFSERSDTGLSDAEDLGIGPDGNIWIDGLEFQHLALVRFKDGSFHLHRYPTVLPNSPPAGGLVAGPDGNVWLVDEGAGGGGPRCGPYCPEGFLVVYVRHELDVVPDALIFSGTGQSQSIAVSETQFIHSFSATTGNPAVATVVPGITQSTFVVTSTGAGTTQIRVSDGRGNSFLVDVTVSSPWR